MGLALRLPGRRPFDRRLQRRPAPTATRSSSSRSTRRSPSTSARSTSSTAGRSRRSPSAPTPCRGSQNEVSFTATETGTYEGASTRFSGPGYATMRTRVIVVEPDEYEAFLEGAGRRHRGRPHGRPGTGPERHSTGSEIRAMTPIRTASHPEVVSEQVPRAQKGWITLVTTAEHKAVGRMYIATALFFASAALAEFLMMRLQLMIPENTLIRPEIFDRLLSAYGVTGLILFALPLMIGLMSVVVPLQIGARGMALPRLHHLSYWLYVFGGATIYASFLYRPSEAGILALPPLSSSDFLPGAAVDAWLIGFALVAARLRLLLDQHDRHDPQLAGARHGAAADAALLLGRRDRQLHAAGPRPGLPRRDRDADDRPPLRRRLLRLRRGRQADALRAPRDDLHLRSRRLAADRARWPRSPRSSRPSRASPTSAIGPSPARWSPSPSSRCSAGCRACTRARSPTASSTSRC